MAPMEDSKLLVAATKSLRSAGARFAYLFGSLVEGNARPSADLDVAVFMGQDDIDVLDVAATLPPSVDLLVLDNAPLELAGRVALRGRLLLDDDPPARVAWEATTRKIYADEQPRITQARRDFVAAAVDRGRR